MSEVEIPDDVLELAAQAARNAYLSVPAWVDGLLLPRWEAVVKAVAWTLDDENTVVLAKCDERDALKARVEVLTAALTAMVFQFGGHFVGVASQEAALDNARAALAK